MTQGLILPRLVSASSVIKMYAHTNGGPAEVREQLAFHLREGDLRARAWHVWDTRQPDMLKAWKEEPDRALYVKPHCVRRQFNIRKSSWWRSADWRMDQELWHMRKNRFVITLDSQDLKRTMIRGIGFHGQDLQKCFGLPKIAPVGRKIRVEEVRQFWHEVIRLIQNGDTDFGLLGTTPYKSDDTTRDIIIKRLKDHNGEKDLEERWYIDALEKKAPFKYGEDFVETEVKHLRARFGLTRASIMQAAEAAKLASADEGIEAVGPKP